MSIDEQHRATARAAKHRGNAEDLAEWAFTNRDAKPIDIQIAVGLAAIVHLLLAIEDRLNYGSPSILDGTISCRICRAIVLDENTEGHKKWHASLTQGRLSALAALPAVPLPARR